jgi:hypothetical protein
MVGTLSAETAAGGDDAPRGACDAATMSLRLNRIAPTTLFATVLMLGMITAADAGPETAFRHAQVELRPTSQRHPTLVSSNWAGYVATPTDGSAPARFRSVSARWVQPRVTCVLGQPSYSAFWVGLGGASTTSQALEQIGTQGNCDPDGRTSYSMWWEVVPAPSVTIPYKVFVGNVVQASVTVAGTKVTLQIRNLTRRTTFTKRLQVEAPDVSSAEWIAEAPSSCTGEGSCVVLQLANFGSASFTRASATAGGHTGSITDTRWAADPTVLLSSEQFVDSTGQTWAVGAAPSAPSSKGASFTVAWQFAPVEALNAG